MVGDYASREFEDQELQLMSTSKYLIRLRSARHMHSKMNTTECSPSGFGNMWKWHFILFWKSSHQWNRYQIHPCLPYRTIPLFPWSFISLIFMTMISENEHKMTYMYNYHINHTITEHTSSNLHVHTRACLSATCLHAWIQEISPGGGSRPNTFQGVLTLSRGGGGVSNCYFL